MPDERNSARQLRDRRRHLDKTFREALHGPHFFWQGGFGTDMRTRQPVLNATWVLLARLYFYVVVSPSPSVPADGAPRLSPHCPLFHPRRARGSKKLTFAGLIFLLI